LFLIAFYTQPVVSLVNVTEAGCINIVFTRA